MASCALTTDYSFGCDVGIGGTKECYIIELSNVTNFTESSGTLTAITKVAGSKFRKYQLVLETANFEETITGDRKNGTLFYPQKGSIVINKQSVIMRNEILLLAKNKCVVVIKDNNLTYRLFGREYGLQVVSGSATTGVAWGDRNGYTLEFTGVELELSPFVQDSVILTLQTLGA